MIRKLAPAALWVARQTDAAWGLVLALSAVAWTWGFASHFGTGWNARIAGFSTVLVGLGIGFLGRRFVNTSSAWMPRALLTAAAVVSTWWIATVAGLTSGLPLTTLTSTGILVRLIVCGAVTVLPAAMLAGVSFPADPRRARKTLLGCGLGLCLLPVTAIAWLGLNVATLAVATLYGVLIALRMSQETDDAEPAADRGAMPAPTSADASLWSAVPLAICAGLVMGVSARWAFQLYLDTPVWVLGRWGMLVCGLALGAWCVASDRRRGVWFGAVTLGCVAATAIVGYPSIIRDSLAISATVSPVWMTLGLKGFFAGLLPFAAGTAMAAAAIGCRPRLTAPLAGCGLIAGLACAVWAGPVLIACSFACAAVALVMALRAAPHRDPYAPFLRVRGTLTWSLSAAAGVMAVAALIGSERYSPALAARVLFHSPFNDAYVSGRSLEQMVHSDSTRLLSIVDSPDSVWTVWKQRDAYVQLRENGLARGMVSLDTGIAPQSAPDVVTTVLPLVLHGEAQNVLFLGMKSPAMLATSIEFPIYSIRCVESDPAVQSIIRDQIAPATQTSLFRDDRVEWIEADPLLAARADHGATYDVIISQEGQALPWGTAPRWTRDHLASVSKLLSDSGIFCQRFLYGDFTDHPVRELVSTLRTVFPHVTAVEPLPGEILFLCSNGKPVVPNEHLMSRLDRVHVRHVLGRMGWDWSVVMGLNFIPAESIDQFAGTAPTNTAANARFVATLTQEAYRWGPKWNSVRTAMAPLQTTTIKQLGKESTELFDIAKRIEDIQLASKIVGAHPDEFWEYRKALRDRLKDRPRTAVVQVKHEGLKYGLHEEDTRRKEYLVALGAAVQNDPPAPGLVSDVAAFAEPFDPLLSPFVYEEVARLYGKCRPRVSKDELRHWQHAVYFGTGNDRSVRNVVSTVELLHTAPESISDPVARWDALQSLLEVMRERWIIRAQLARTNRSKFETVDLSRSITAAEVALTDLDALATEVGVVADGWATRRKGIERDLIRELESYRAEREAQAAAERRAAAARVTNSQLPGGPSPL